MMDKQDQQRALAMSHDPTNSDRSFHELRLDVDAGRETFDADEVRSLLACIDSLDAELMAAVNEEEEAKFERRAAMAEVEVERLNAELDDLRGLLTRGIEFVEESAKLEKRAQRAEAEVERLRANPDRAAAYALVCRELVGCDVSTVHPGYEGEPWVAFGETSQSDAPTLLAVVDKLRGDGRGESENA